MVIEEPGQLFFCLTCTQDLASLQLPCFQKGCLSVCTIVLELVVFDSAVLVCYTCLVTLCE